MSGFSDIFLYLKQNYLLYIIYIEIIEILQVFVYNLMG